MSTFLALKKLTIGERTAASLKVSFEKVAGDTGSNMNYKVSRQTQGGQPIEKTCHFNTQPCLIDGLSPGTEYTLSVKACPTTASHACSEKSPDVQAWTLPQCMISSISFQSFSLAPTSPCNVHFSLKLHEMSL